LQEKQKREGVIQICLKASFNGKKKKISHLHQELGQEEHLKNDAEKKGDSEKGRAHIS